ncbi:MBL fold metallo-hydrolase, partial [Arundinibacter roseus]
MKTIRKIMVYFILFLVLSGAGIWLFMQQAVFGAEPEGTRLERIKKSQNYREGSFKNQSFTPDLAEGVTYWDILKAYLAKSVDREPTQALPSVKTNLKTLISEEPAVVWFGHSSYLIKLAGKTILIDPVFSGNASPVSFFGKNYEGSNVYTAEDFPNIDLLVLTHDHYDHLDYATVTALRSGVKKVVTALGVGAHLEKWGYDSTQIQELDWQEEIVLDSTLTLTALPARHFSGRGFKRNQTLWASYMLRSPNYSIYIGGDSG